MNNILTGLIQNIINRLSLLQQDFIAFNLDLTPLLTLILGFIFSAIFFSCSYFIGNQLRKKNTSDINIPNLTFFIDITLGYLLIGSGIAILGFFSLLNFYLIWIYIFIVFTLTGYLFLKQEKQIKENKKQIKVFLGKVKQNKFIFIWTFIFVFIALINLVNPEIREDQYHVDFPKIYLNQQTIMIPPMEQLHVSAAPLLSEMTYLIGIFIWSNESARYIHFMFYLLVIFTLFSIGLNTKYKFSIYTPLLFASAPVVIHETSSMYVDFQWMLMFLLSFYLISSFNKISIRLLFLIGLLIGGMVSIKLWTIVLIPVLIVFILWKIKPFDIHFIKKSVVLFLAILIFPSIWFLRSFLLTGNPFYPAFSSIVNLENTKEYYGIFHYIGVNTSLINPMSLINVFSPLFFIGVILIIYKLKSNISFLKLYLFKIVAAILLLYLSIQYPFGRYLLGLYIVLIFFSSVGIFNFVNNFKNSKIILSIFLFLISSYYLINSILILPYSFNLADKNKYLTRTLSKDNSSYYDFDRKFDKYISNNDYVATYKIFGYYYANFKFLDINFIFNKNNRSINIMRSMGFKYFFSKDFTIQQMCINLSITDCDTSSYKLISSYNKYPNYYLYELK